MTIFVCLLFFRLVVMFVVDGGNFNKPAMCMVSITLDDCTALIHALRQYYQLNSQPMPDACMNLSMRLIRAQSELLQDDVQALLGMMGCDADEL